MLHILFCFYFLSLAVLPCGDKDDCNEIKHEQTAQNNEDHDHEICTPFCVCSCCATHFVMRPFQYTQNQVVVINTVYTVHPESETSTAIIPVWQPPKLA